MLLSDLLRLPTWRNGRRAAFRSQSLHGGVGSNPIVGTNFIFFILFSTENITQRSVFFCIEIDKNSFLYRLTNIRVVNYISHFIQTADHGFSPFFRLIFHRCLYYRRQYQTDTVFTGGNFSKFLFSVQDYPVLSRTVIKLFAI